MWPSNPPVGAPAAGPELFPIDIAPAIQPDAAALAPASALFPAAFAPGPDSDLDLGAIAFIEPIVNITADSAETVTSGLSLAAFGQAVLVELPPTPATGAPSEPPPPTEVILQEQQEAQDAEVRHHGVPRTNMQLHHTLLSHVLCLDCCHYSILLQAVCRSKMQLCHQQPRLVTVAKHAGGN